MSPEEWIRHIRREHAEISHPVACCRKDHQNWPCDTIRALDAGAAAERNRIAALLDEAAANYPADVFPVGSDSRDAISGTAMRHAYRNAASLIREQP